MKRNRFIYSMLAFLASLMLPAGCVEEQSPEANAVQTKETEVVFAAKNAEPQTISVFADGEWLADVTEDWIDLSVMSGDKNTEVTISVTGDNVDNKGALNAPRTGTITFKGRSDERIGVVTVIQKGDNYLGVGEFTVTQVAKDLKDEDKFKIAEATVMAASDGGFVITDGTTLMYAEGDREVSAGDKIFMNGTKATIGGIPAVKADEVEVLSKEEVKYPEPESIGKDMLGKVTYVQINGTLLGTTLILEEGKGNILDAPSSFEIGKLNVHKVLVTGYYVGLIDKQYSLVLTSIEDKGADAAIGQPLPFKDDFSWLAPFIEQANAALDPANKISDCVAGAISSADGAANIYTTLVDKGVKVLEELRLRGYTDLNPDFKTIYLQDAYFKFGASKKQSGLTLPLMKMDGSQDIVVSLKWCCHIGGSGAVDKTNLVLAIDGPGTVVTKAGTPDKKVSDPVESTQESGQMFWQDASFKIEGATTATEITIRSETFGTPDALEAGYFRYYLDDIEVMLAADAVPANITLSGVEDNLITFEGTPEAPFEFDVTADADFSVSSSVKWLTVENGEGLAGETNKVKVTCAESDLNTLRKAELTVKAGITVKKIQVVQSSAGAAIDPFISIVGGNTLQVKGSEQNASFMVQTNVDFETEVVSGAEWLSIIPASSVKALVDRLPVNIHVLRNDGGVRTGKIRIFNKKENLEAYLNVVQTENTLLLAKWDFSEASMNAGYVNTFGGLKGISDKTAGDGGQYIDANKGGKGKITYVQIDKTDLDQNNKAARVCGGTGEPYITGGWPGDYWLITSESTEVIEAGASVHAFMVSRTSGTGMKYFIVEYLDGGEWKPALPAKTKEVNGEQVTYNVEHDDTKNFNIDFTYEVAAATTEVQIRLRCVANAQAKSGAALTAPNGGTHRLKGEDLSPYIEAIL